MKKKKGSSLITVLIFMMFLMIVGVASLTTTTMDYRMRINESKRIENLYGAESGLEIAYDILLKASDYALSEALSKANMQFSYEQKNANVDPINIDDLFKSSYLNALLDESYNHRLEANGKLTTSLMEYALKNLKYPTLNNQQILAFEDSGLDLSSHGIEISLEVLTINSDPYDSLNDLKDGFKVKVTSTYRTSDVNQSSHENERQISRIFEFNLPSYSKAIVDMYPIFKDKILTVDGNVNLNGSDYSKLNLTVDGDVWIGGKSYPQDPNYQFDSTNYVTYEKYENGLLMENANLMLTGSLATYETVSLYNNASLTLNGNLYGKNVYAGKRSIGSISQDVNLEIKKTDQTDGEMILSNDLAVNVTSPILNQDSSLKIHKFYGVSDKNYESLDGVGVTSLSQESSSIIVNGEGASIDILEEAYIGGLAFLDVEDEEDHKYQTGESVAVKPNYLAYSVVLPGYEDQIEMKYYNPLMLVEIMKQGLTDNQAKSEYFYTVHNNNLLPTTAGGVRLPLNRTFSAGATVSLNDEGDVVVNEASGVLELATVIQSKTDELVTEVNKMGYQFNSNMNSDVSELVNWDSDAFNRCSIEEKLCGDIILNRDNVDIKIEKTDTGHKIYLGDQAIDIGNHLFLITKGDLELIGDVNLTGNLIVGGHVSISASTINGTLKYDDEYTKKVLFDYKQDINDLFKGVKNEESLEGDNEQTYDSAAIIKKGRWELKK